MNVFLQSGALYAQPLIFYSFVQMTFTCPFKPIQIYANPKGLHRDAPSYKAELCMQRKGMRLLTKRSFVCNAWECTGGAMCKWNVKSTILGGSERTKLR